MCLFLFFLLEALAAHTSAVEQVIKPSLCPICFHSPTSVGDSPVILGVSRCEHGRKLAHFISHPEAEVEI